MSAMKRRLIVMVNRVVNRIVRLTGMKRFRGARLLYLTTVGRKSGKSRIVPLAFVRDDNDYIVAASNGGSDWQPAWWLNLQSRPQATMEVDGAEVTVTASAVEDEDRDQLWQRLSDQLDTYDSYQSKVRRQIALVRLRPVDQPEAASPQPHPV
jgi:deazaflavin-dependent oxidoreductase (nitroreductase family)